MSGPKILYATTFCASMWDTSAKRLIETYVNTASPHHLMAYTEGMDLPTTPNSAFQRLDEHPFLVQFLKTNRDIIPKELGGDVEPPECRCPKGPLDVHSVKHKLPCVGYWFCRNAFRWLRKVLSANLAAEAHPDYDYMMWVDSDASFLSHISPKVVASWFVKDAACIYVKNKRTAIETGVVGYNLRTGGREILKAMLARYESGKFRTDARWDDCVQLEYGIRDSGKRAIDLATKVGPNNTVIQFSPLKKYLGHDKGLHRRTKVLV